MHYSTSEVYFSNENSFKPLQKITANNYKSQPDNAQKRDTQTLALFSLF